MVPKKSPTAEASSTDARSRNRKSSSSPKQSTGKSKAVTETGSTIPDPEPISRDLNSFVTVPKAPELELSIPKSDEKQDLLEVPEQKSSVEKLAEPEKSLEMVPAPQVSLDKFPDPPTSLVSSNLTSNPGMLEVESPFPGNEADRLQLLLASGSSLVASVYPMKSFEVGQFFGHCSPDNVSEDSTDRSFHSTYLSEMYPLKSFEFSNFSSRPEPEQVSIQANGSSESSPRESSTKEGESINPSGLLGLSLNFLQRLGFRSQK